MGTVFAYMKALGNIEITFFTQNCKIYLLKLVETECVNRCKNGKCSKHISILYQFKRFSNTLKGIIL